MDDPDGYFGEDIAAGYDDATDGEFDPAVIAGTADVLASLAEGGRALEFAIGTGRIAVPLAERGVFVHGIEMSRAMIARLRARNAAIGVTIGDMSTARAEADGPFDLVYLVFNTVMNLTTQDAQIACFANAAAHLRPGGRFLVEVMVPELRKLPAGQTLVPFTVTPTRWGFDRYDVATQAMSSNYVTLSEGGRGEFWSVPFRYLWPAEMDLMARMAGMEPEHRWDSWARAPFGNESGKFIGTWVKR